MKKAKKTFLKLIRPGRPPADSTDSSGLLNKTPMSEAFWVTWDQLMTADGSRGNFQSLSFFAGKTKSKHGFWAAKNRNIFAFFLHSKTVITVNHEKVIFWKQVTSFRGENLYELVSKQLNIDVTLFRCSFSFRNFFEGKKIHSALYECSVSNP